METISDQVISMLLKKLNKSSDQIKPTTRIKEDLHADSLDIVEILMDIEDKYNVKIADDDFNNIKTVGDLTAFVNKMAN